MKKKAFTVTAWLTVLVSKTITADGFEDAVAKAQNMKECDFIDFHGEFVDSRPMRLSWVSDESAEPRP